MPLGASCCFRNSLTGFTGLAWAWPCSTSQPKNRRSVTKARLMVATACPCCRRRPSLKSVMSLVVTRLTQNGSALAWENQAANFRKSWTTARRVLAAKSWSPRYPSTRAASPGPTEMGPKTLSPEFFTAYSTQLDSN